MEMTPPQPGIHRIGVEVVPAAPSQPVAKRPIELHLTDRETGETRVVRDTGEWEGGEFQDYLWSEGNFGCDCNRLIKMYGDADDDRPCSNGRVSLRIVDPATGAEIYNDE